MKTTHKEFHLDESIQRIDKILATENKYHVENEYDVYDIDDLEYEQTLYKKVVCMSIDIQTKVLDFENDINTTIQHKCLLSEFGAVINECQDAVEYTKSVFNVFSAFFVYKPGGKFDSIIDVAAKLCSLLSMLNLKFSARNLEHISICMGISYNTIKITREAFEKDIDPALLWTGPALDESISIAKRGAISMQKNSLYISKSVYERLSEKYRTLFSYDNVTDCFTSSLINRQFEKWIQENISNGNNTSIR